MTQLASDDFNRADGALGANWTTMTGLQAPVIASNEAKAGPALSSALYTGTVAPNDGYAEITIGSVVNTTSDEGVGPSYRASGAAATAYFAQTNTVETKLYKVVASAFTQLGSDAAACATGNVLRVTCNGTAISVQKNGSTIIGPITDASIASGSAGIFGTNSVPVGTINDFAFGNLTVVTGTPLINPRRMSGGMHDMSRGM